MEDAPRYGLNIKKGTQGFQSIPEEDKAKNIVGIRLTDAEKDTLKNHAVESGKSMSDITREALSFYFRTKGIEVRANENTDPNQLQIEV